MKIINVLKMGFFCCALAALNVFADSYPIEQFPSTISADCRGGIAKVYDECSDQAIVLKDALESANKSSKTVLIVFGAEWCIWCHVFDKYVHGYSRKFNYEWEQDGQLQKWKMREKDNKNAQLEARTLNQYVSENFVVAHIEGGFAPNGMDVMAETGLDMSQLQFLPFIMVVDDKGQYSAHMQAYDAIKGLEIREDSGKEYRGFDRVILMNELKKMRDLTRLK